MTNKKAPPQTKASTDRWENEGGQMAARKDPARDLKRELELHGIVPVTLTVFDWGGYRYSNASDAIAAARRLAKSA